MMRSRTTAFLCALIFTCSCSATLTDGPATTIDHGVTIVEGDRTEHGASLTGVCTAGTDDAPRVDSYRVADESVFQPPRFWCRWQNDNLLLLYMDVQQSDEPTVVFVDLVLPQTEKGKYYVSGTLETDGAVLTLADAGSALEDRFAIYVDANPDQRLTLRMSCERVCEATLLNLQFEPL